ncbi:MAG: dipeptide epimerase [Myxococcales bacterium]|nr:dipeptide epimerase [Myxococcales bacterium]
MTRSWTLVDLDVLPVDIALREPFGIATGAKTAALNVFVRATLADGTRGWGEAAPFEAVNGERREVALGAIHRARDTLVGWDARAWRSLGGQLRELAPESPSARCAIETAVLDAITRSLGISLATFFGGLETELFSDLTITTGTAARARESAFSIARQGYRTIKLKVGGSSVADDVARIRAVIEAAPSCSLVLDGNAALTQEDAVAIALECKTMGGELALFEQPCAREDDDAAIFVHDRARVLVCADESVGSVKDVARLARKGAAQAINLKITKSGVVECYDMACVARAHGLGLMVGGMVESSMAMSASAHLACGVGGVEFVDLDTPLWLVDEPVVAEMTREGPRLSIAKVRAGHGARPSDAWLAERRVEP